MSKKLKAPKGTQDILPPQSRGWQAVERVAREVARLYGFEEIRTPAFEETALFHRGVGEATDIVQKETYTFDTRGGTSITLRPEGTAPVVRALLQHSLLDNEGATAKVYYVGTPMFRYERPQAGRYRQHHQFGIEAFGVAAPEQDVECILLQSDFYRRCGLGDVRLDLNTLGDAESKARYRDTLRDFFAPKVDNLSEDSKRRLDANPLRILDSKDPKDVAAREDVPSNLESLSDKSRAHFARVRELLDAAGQAYDVNPNLVRGLDYYTDTLWEYVAGGLGAQAAVGGGGRYDALVETLGGKPTPGVGFGMGMERLLLALEAQGDSGLVAPRPLVWIVAQSDAAKGEAFALLRELRGAGIAADSDFTGRNTKGQFKLADRAGATQCLILGDRELEAGTVALKDMSTGEQREVSRGQLLEVMTASDDGGPH